MADEWACQISSVIASEGEVRYDIVITYYVGDTRHAAARLPSGRWIDPRTGTDLGSSEVASAMEAVKSTPAIALAAGVP